MIFIFFYFFFYLFPLLFNTIFFFLYSFFFFSFWSLVFIIPFLRLHTHPLFYLFLNIALFIQSSSLIACDRRFYCSFSIDKQWEIVHPRPQKQNPRSNNLCFHGRIRRARRGLSSRFIPGDLSSPRLTRSSQRYRLRQQTMITNPPNL